MGSDIFYLLIYINDILLIRSSLVLLEWLVRLLSSKFKLRDLGVAHYFLGIEIQPTSMDLMLRQHKYTLNILHRVSMSSCKLIDTLASSSKHTLASSSKLDMMTGGLFSDPTCFLSNCWCSSISHFYEIKYMLFCEQSMSIYVCSYQCLLGCR